MIKIGKKIDPAQATHEFIGLAKFSKTGAEQFLQTYHDALKNLEGKVQEAEDAGADHVCIQAFRPDGTPSRPSGTLVVQYTGATGPATFDVNLVGEVLPPATTETAMSIKLTWDSNGTDVDLHFVGPGGTFYESPLDHALGERRIQSVATPYQGTPLASLGSFACGDNNDMTPSP